MQKQPPDELVPDPVVWKEFGITSMTLYRWTNDAKLNFPPPIKIRTKNFRSRRALEEFKGRMLRIAISSREVA
jgi:predicted DNA-binding transcriptional regulator AlpA